MDSLRDEIVGCERCPRLRLYCTEVAAVKRRAFRDQEYWGRPVPPLGDACAKLLIVGLAPAAHGGNRTGRMFTGDRSGDWLYRILHRTGFASQPESISRDDGLRLIGAYITAVARCAPPDNKPLPQEIRNCRPFLERELEMLKDLRVVVALGKIAFDNYLAVLCARGDIARRAPFIFGHGREHVTGPGQPLLIASYHPSQQNTSTGRLNEPMLFDVFDRARRVADQP
ncbi:MAG TPA: uracil-DNA glycosylase [Bryobacteraceae bacterium]|nr:uracil-DNA glycosylase [Bryobacteraceae bacterium]